MIPYGRQFIDEEDIKAVVEVLRSPFITQGPKIAEFEEKLASYCGAKFAVAFSSGTAALHAAYFSVGLSDGDEFITTPITFAATANAGLFLKAKPIFVDIEKDTGNIDVNLIEEAITSKTKLIVPVHYAGFPVDMKKIRSIAEKYGLKVVEDACHALGAEYEGCKIGSCKYSDATVFSFHPVKHITTGEGGAVLTDSEEIYQKLLMFRNHGITKDEKIFERSSHGPWYYEMQFLGYNYRITDIQAALGISQLKKLPKFLEKRRKIVKFYEETLKNSPLFYIPKEKHGRPAWHLYPVRFKDKYLYKKREIFISFLEKGIGVQVHYIPVYKHPFYQRMGYTYKLPNAEDFYKREISLPIYPSLKDEELNKIIEVIDWITENIR